MRRHRLHAVTVVKKPKVCDACEARAMVEPGPIELPAATSRFYRYLCTFGFLNPMLYGCAAGERSSALDMCAAGDSVLKRLAQ